MKKLFLLLFASINLYALTLTLNSAREEKVDFAVLHLIDKEPIFCKEIIQEFDKKICLCKVDKISSTKLHEKDTRFVNIDFLQKEKEFYIKIEPKNSLSIFPVKSALHDKKESTKERSQKYKHWIFLFYKNKPPFLRKEKKIEGINFPVTYAMDPMPSIGALDLSGEPISYASDTKDINYYLAIKKEFENKKYESVITNCEKVMRKYPNSIFTSELILYKLRSMDRLIWKVGLDNSYMDIQNDDITELGKEWIKKFPSDENIPEVLMYIAKSYLNLGFRSDAEYFFDILITEHIDSKFTKMGILHLADYLYRKNQKLKAIDLYKNVLYSAKDINVASEAAIRLADKSLLKGDTKTSRGYYKKIIDANEKFLLKDPVKAHDLAQRLSNNKLSDVAATIAEKLVETLNNKSSLYQISLKDAGVWNEESGNNKKAYGFYKRYLEEYKYGEYSDIAQEGLDRVIFDFEEDNKTKLMQYYDRVIKNYKNSIIGDKAIVKKALFLLKDKQYDAVLGMQGDLKDVADRNVSGPEGIIDKTATQKAKDAIEKDMCLESLETLNLYKVDLPNSYNEKLYECSMRLSRYDQAYDISEKHFQDKDLSNRAKWMEKGVYALQKSMKYQNAIDLANDVVSLSRILKKDSYSGVIYGKFYSYAGLGNFAKALSEAKEIEEKYENDHKNIDVFAKIVNLALKQGDDLIVQEYSQKVIELQNLHQNHALSPKIELDHIISLKNMNKNKEALKAIDGLLQQNDLKGKRARILYVGAEISTKMKDVNKTKRYFQECSEVKEESSWKNICKESLKLLK